MICQAETRDELYDGLYAKHSVRISKKFAQELLQTNYDLVIGGRVRFVKVKHIGLGVYQVEVDYNAKETYYA